jgi:hypothetical protein
VGKTEDRLSDFINRGLSSVAGIRLGPGAVGNTHTVALVALIAICVVTWALREVPLFALGVDVLILAYCIYLSRWTERFAKDHPDLALLGGAHLLQLRQLQMGAKGVSEIPLLQPVEAPAIARSEPSNGA